MSDVRESFPTLEDGSGVGHVLAKVLEGDAAAGKNAAPALVAKDSSGNLKYLLTDTAGNLVVNIDGAGIPKKGRGKLVGTTSLSTVFDIALTAGETYQGLHWVCSCLRDALFEIVLIDDPTGTPVETILAEVVVGAGDYTDSGEIKPLEFTAGATGPVLRVRAKNFNTTSDMRASLVTKELAA